MLPFGSNCRIIGRADNSDIRNGINGFDAPGDLQAAQSNAVFFYPIIPEKEVESWFEFKDTYLPFFINGRYAECEQLLIDRFYSELED